MSLEGVNDDCCVLPFVRRNIQFDDWDECRNGRLIFKMSFDIPADQVFRPEYIDRLVAYLTGDSEESPEGSRLSNSRWTPKEAIAMFGPVRFFHWSAGLAFVAAEC